MLYEAVNVIRHLEEVRFLPCLRNGTAAIGALTLSRLSRSKERLAGSTVPPLIEALVYIALIVEFLKYLLDGRNVIIVGSADEVIVIYVHKIPYSPDLTCYSVYVCLGSNACLVSKILYLLSVLVSTRAQEHVLTHSALKACKSIGHYYLIGISEMRLTRRIRNSGSKIKLFHLFLQNSIKRDFLPTYCITLLPIIQYLFELLLLFFCYLQYYRLTYKEK